MEKAMKKIIKMTEKKFGVKLNLEPEQIVELYSYLYGSLNLFEHRTVKRKLKNALKIINGGNGK